jgi:uncharacterized RDD family membrane protein YckC
MTLKKQVIYAGFSPRLFAALIDSLIFFLCISPLLYLLTGSFDPDSMASGITALTTDTHLSVEERQTFTLFITKNILELLCLALLTIGFWIYCQATPGKILMRLTIVDSTTLQPAKPYQYIIRFFAYILSFLPLCLGFVWMNFNKKKQGWHDKCARTCVIKK